MGQYRIDFESFPWEALGPGRRQKVMVQNGRKLRLVEFTPEFVETDWCRKCHLGYVLEGEVEIDLNGTVTRFRAGDGVFIPGGEESKHMLKVSSGTARLFLIEDT